jgi:uncharacterized membrane protein YgdD (TMEM256/DUF423 family)
MERSLSFLASILGGLGVVAGAFGAHALSRILGAQELNLFETAARYQMYHALALLGVAWALTHWPASAGLLRLSGWSFTAGIVLFSGSLYAYAITGLGWLPAITPIGGISFAIGWLTLAIGVWRG